MRRRCHFWLRWMGVLAGGIGSALCSYWGIAAGPDYLREEHPVVDTMEDAEGLLTESFDEKRFEKSRFPRLKRRLDALAPFWRDASLALQPRSYYFHRDRDTGDSAAWTLGGALDYRSGWWNERLRAVATLYTSQKLYGPTDKDGTLLLEPGQSSFTVLGEAYGELQLREGLVARAGRTALDLPYLNRQDNRMVPNTFQAYGLGGNLSESLEVAAAQVTHMKRRSSDDFEPMSKAAGLHGTDKPATVAGMRYRLAEAMNLGFINLYAWDFMNTFYAEGNLGWQATDDLAVGASAQYTDQRSIGDELGGEFDTDVYGLRLSATYQRATLKLAFSRTDSGSRIRSPFGSYPGYLSLMIKDFNRAGEDAWVLGVAYDFSAVGWEGVSGFVNYAEGYVHGLPDQRELDLTLDIRPALVPWEGFWLRLRHARVDEEGQLGDDVRDWRVILNYTVPVL